MKKNKKEEGPLKTFSFFFLDLTVDHPSIYCINDSRRRRDSGELKGFDLTAKRQKWQMQRGKGCPHL